MYLNIMVKKSEKIEASIMFGSFLDTLGFKNGSWEFNYQIEINNLMVNTRVWNRMLHHFLILGGPHLIDLTNWNASDDTLMILATGEAIIDAKIEGSSEDSYKKKYVDYYDLLLDEKRASGINTIEMLKLLKRNAKIPSSDNMGGNGAAMRTGPIGLVWHNNIDKVIQESIIASRLTHNYYLGYLGGMVTALFTAFAMNGVEPWFWCDELIKLHQNKTIHKYYPPEHKESDLDDYINYWKRYKEIRLSKLKFKNSLDSFIYPEDRLELLLGFFPNPRIKNIIIKGQSLKGFPFDWGRVGSTGLDVCIYAYDCLLMSITTPGSKTIDFDNVVYSWDTFCTLVAVHPGDNDSTASVGGTWYGALLGYNGFDKDRMKQLEFYKDLKKMSDKLISL